MNTEVDRARQILFTSLMQVPHRQYGPMVAALAEALEQDPEFTSRACAFLATSSEIRDQQDSAIIALLQASPTFPEFREAGRCLLLGSDVYKVEPKTRGVPPFRFFRIEEHIRGSQRKVPRLMRGCVTDWVRNLESNERRFDGVALGNRKALKRLYVTRHIRPSDFARALLFDDDPPERSKLHVMKRIARTDDVAEKLSLVMEHRIPLRIAQSVLPKRTPAVSIALIEVMSPTEALNSRAWVERSGILEHPEVKAAYLEKVGKATASVASASHRVSAQGKDQEVQQAVEKAKEKAIKSSKRIERKTLLLVDKSSSMHRAISVAVEFGARIAPLCDDLMVVVFNDYAQEITVKGDSLQDWNRAFRTIRPGGYTSPVQGYKLATGKGFMPEEVVIVTDGGENVNSISLRVRDDERAGHPMPHFSVIKVPGDRDVMTRDLESVGARVDVFRWSGDYYIFDQVAALLGGPKALTLVERILATELPRRVR